ncbi:MAG: hypothetical protein O7I42_16130 [Alphaproteobacteria bacterium]|nr:hypothetical protein [Alphaproteobacteria bacterium]
MSAASEPRRFGFLLVPKFAVMAFTSAVEPLRAADLLSGRKLYARRPAASSRSVTPRPRAPSSSA